MAFTAKLYGPLAGHLFAKRIDWVNDTIKLSLHTSTYTPDQDAHDFQNDLTNELSTGGGYTSGGVTLASKTATYNTSTNVLTLDAADIAITSSTLTWRTAVIYDATPGTSATNPLIAYFQNDADIVSTGGTTSITFAANGIATLTVT